MQLFRVIFAILPLILLAGALVLLILTLLSGGVQKTPINKFYYLQAALTSDTIMSPDNMLRFTNYNVCGVQNGLNVNCGPTKAAYGFSPATNLPNTTPALPQSIIDHNSRSRTTSRTFYAFLLMAAFFTMVAMFMSLAGCLGRLGSFLGLVFAFIAFVMCAIAASLMTVVYVRARNEFRAGGISADVGVKLFAFVWTAVAATFLALFIFLIGACIPGEKRSSRRKTRKARSYQEKPLVTDTESYHPVQPSTYVAPEPTSVYDEAPRSSYERTVPRTTGGGLAPPIDGLHTTGESGATYIR